MKGTEMTTDEAAGTASPLPFDTIKAHQARIYDYVLGGHFLLTHISRRFGRRLLRRATLLVAPGRLNVAYMGSNRAENGEIITGAGRSNLHRTTGPVL
jgi:hypothetical protein